MRPNTANLAMRDPALAAALGGLPGADYGSERGRAAFGGFGGYSPYDPSRNIGFGNDWGVDAPPPPPPPMMPPPPPPPGHPAHHGHHGHAGHHVAPWLAHYNAYMGRHMSPPFYDGLYDYYGHSMPTGPNANNALMWAAQAAATARRAAILDPNEHSRLKIERYTFSFPLLPVLTLGTGPTPIEGTLQPNTRIRPQRIVMNSPDPNFVLIDTIQMANVNVLVGETEDSYTYNANGQGVMLDLPTLDPANRATVSGTYTGYLPRNYASEFQFTFIVTFQGPSTIVGGL